MTSIENIDIAGATEAIREELRQSPVGQKRTVDQLARALDWPEHVVRDLVQISPDLALSTDQQWVRFL